MNTFNVIVMAIFGFFLLAGFATLTLYGALQRNAEPNVASSDGNFDVLVWGSLDSNNIERAFRDLSSNKNYRLRYVQKDENTIIGEYVNSVSFGGSPDLLILNHTDILSNEVLFERIPYSIMSRADYETRFINTEHFIREDGFVTFPLVLDSLVLYYNENFRLQNKIGVIPSTWDSFTDRNLIQNKNIRNGQILKAVIPFGAYSNYNNSAEVLLSLALQNNPDASPFNSEDTINFYTSFGDPESSLYNWRNNLPNAKDFFISGNLLFYPGKISEYVELTRSNPNLITRVTEFPSLNEDSNSQLTGTLYGITVSKTSLSKSILSEVMFDIIGLLYGENSYDIFGLPPALNNLESYEDTPLIERTFNNTVFRNKLIQLSTEDRRAINSGIRNVVIGVEGPRKLAKMLNQLLTERK